MTCAEPGKEHYFVSVVMLPWAEMLISGFIYTSDVYKYSDIWSTVKVSFRLCVLQGLSLSSVYALSV